MSWKRIGPAGKQGLAGAQGATGAQGVQGQPGANGAPGQPGIDDFNDLEGMPCTRDSQPGSIDLVFGPGAVARTRCVLPGDGPVCGDGVTEGGEACDDGNGDPTDGCTNTCQVASCGDGVVQQGVEQCDTAARPTICDANCTTAYCGDGTTNSARGEQCDRRRLHGRLRQRLHRGGLRRRPRQPAASEECDDGNQVDTDECTNMCQFAP